MNNINNYLRINKIITNDIYNRHKEFNYDNKDEFKIILDHLIDIYNISLVEPKQLRTEQQKFRNKIIARDKCCIISGFDESECEAAHIVPLNIEYNFDQNNGILLNSNLHKTYDDGYWCINPESLNVELNINKINDKKLSCLMYNNIKANIHLNDEMLFYLNERYKMFKQ